MPAGLTALSQTAGGVRLERALRADHDALIGALQSQEKGAWCGVASAVTVLNASGERLDQDGLFTPEASAVRSWWRTTLSGMPIDDLAGLLRAHGASAEQRFAEDASVDDFRGVVRSNLAQAGDWLVVNYDRAVLGEVGGGHISPLSAYDPVTDEVLLLDVATYKYEPHWVPLGTLFDAMDTPDSESGHSRGWVEVQTL